MKDNYKEKLIALCCGLEIEEIDKLLTETPEHFRKIGEVITNSAKQKCKNSKNCKYFNGYLPVIADKTM